MKKSIFLFFAAILCATSAWAGPSFNGGCVYFHNKGGWNDTYKYICISHDSWTEPRAVTVITNTQLWYNALPTSGWTDAKYMSAMGHSSSKSANNFKVSTCNHYTANVSLGNWGFNNGNAQMLTPASGSNNAELELTYVGNSYSSMNKTITVKAKVSTNDGATYSEATSPGTLSASSFAFTSYTSCKSAKTLSNGKITCGYTANTTLTAADADGYTFDGWYDAAGTKQTADKTLSINPTADATYYAYYTREALAEETHDVTISYVCGSTSIKENKTETGVGVSTPSEISAPSIDGYKFDSWSFGTGVQSTDAETANPIDITTKTSGIYTLTANYSELPKVTVYAINSVNWDAIAVHHWPKVGAGTSWPGDLMTNTGEKAPNGFDVYTATFLAEHENCIFNNNDNGKQTGDLTVEDGHYYDLKSETWYASLAEVPAPDPLATDVFLAGSMNGWSTTANEFKKVEEGSATATLTMNLEAETKYEFKVMREGAWTSSKENRDIRGSVSELVFSSSVGDNTMMTTTVAGDYVFTWNDSKLSITYPASTEPDPTPDPAETETVYFVNANDWTGTIYAYAWTDGTPEVKNHDWPGVAAQKEANQIGGHDVYSYTAEKGKYENVIFSGDGDKQTDDLAWTADKYYVRDGWYTKDEAEAKLATPVEDVYTIVGSTELVGAHWDVNNTENDMIKQTDGSYVLTITNVELAVSGNYEYKVVKNRSWEWKEINGGNNITLTGVEEDGVYNITFTLTKELNALNVSLELVESKEIILDCFVAGDESLVGTGKGWTADAIKMVHDEGTKIYTATISNVPAGTHNMKVVYGGDWLGFDKLATPVPANVTEGDDNKIQFTLAEAGNVTITYHATNGIGLSGNFAAPTPTTYTVVGHKDILGESWNLASTINIMTETDGNYTLTKTGLKLEAGDYEYKVVKNGAYGEGEYPNGTNEKVTITENGVYTIVYTYKVGTSLEAVATKTGDYTPDKATYTVAGDIALCGTNWKADDETNDMTDNGDGTFMWTKSVELAKNVEFKIVKNRSFDVASYPSDNKVIDIKDGENYKTGVYTIVITFTEATKEIQVIATRTGDLPKKTLVYTVTVPAGTKQCYIAGGMNEWTAQPMTPAGTNKFSISIDNVTIATEYKYTCKDGDDTWAYVEKKNGNGGVVNRTYNANDVVERWNRIDISDGENAAIIGSHKGKGVVEVQVNRQFEAGNLYTLSLPFTMSGKSNIENIFGNGTIVYEFSKLEKDDEDLVLYFNNAITTIEAGKPYLIQPGQDVDGFRYENVDVDDTNKSVTNSVDGTTITMESVLSVAANAMTNGKYWLASDNILYRTNTSLLSLRAVFDIQSTKANIRARVAFGENVETGVDNIVTTDAPVKVIKNGQLIIIRDGVKYNVQGQKL